MTAYMTTTEEVKKMVSALAQAGVFTIFRTSETVTVNHTSSGKLVLAGLKKGASNAWIMRQHPELFA